jgi:hypothetical protein
MQVPCSEEQAALHALNEQSVPLRPAKHAHDPVAGSQLPENEQLFGHDLAEGVAKP